MAQRRKTMREPVALGRVVDHVLDALQRQADPALAELGDVWNRAVGSGIAANTRPVVFKNGRLIVHVTSSTWIYELQFLKQEIIRKINAGLDNQQIKDILFKIGPV